MTEDFRAAYRTTFSAATHVSERRPVTNSELETIVTYLDSPGSGGKSGVSFSDLISSRMALYPPLLPQGFSYVAYSGMDGHSVSNFFNAKTYLRNIQGNAGTIGETPWGALVSKAGHDPEIARAADMFASFLQKQRIAPKAKETIDSLADAMWNAGSPEFIRNAEKLGRNVIAFVDGAPENRGFSNHELPIFSSSRSMPINGTLLADKPGDKFALAKESAVAYRAMEIELAGAASLYSHNNVSVSTLRGRVDMSYVYDADKDTLFGEPRETFARRSFDDMAETADRWSRTHARTTGDVTYRTPVERAQGVALDGAHARGMALHDGPLPVTPTAAGTDASFSRDAWHVAPAGMSRAVGVVNAAGQVATVVDAAATARSAVNLSHAGNTIGMQSEVVHFASRNLSGWAGAVAGAEAAAAAGIETGPGALVAGGVGAVVGAVGGEKIASAVDDYRTYHQTDHTGQSWRMDPAHPEQGWTHTTTRPDAGASSPTGLGFSAPAYTTETLSAPPDVANELNYKASGVQVQLALAHPPAPRDPYTVSANATDTPSLRQADWHRDPTSRAWQRDVTTGYLEHGQAMTRREFASPSRAAELNETSTAIAAANHAHRPSTIAQRYLDAHKQYGWDRFGPPEASALDAARAPTNALQASDGNEYTRGPDGSWKHEGWFGRETQARGNLRDELDEAARATGLAAPGLKHGPERGNGHERINEMLEAARSGDWNTFRQQTQELAQAPAAQETQRQAVHQANQIEHAAAQEQAAQLATQAQQQNQQQQHVHRMVR